MNTMDVLTYVCAAFFIFIVTLWGVDSFFTEWDRQDLQDTMYHIDAIKTGRMK